MLPDPRIEDATIQLQELVMQVLVGDRVRSELLPGFRPALKKLRDAFTTGSRIPDYSERSARAVYALAYFPHRVMAYANMFQRAGLETLGLDTGAVRLVVLGAGPGSEIVGLLHAANCLDWGNLELDITLLDREPGWKNSHLTTLVRAGTKILGREIEVNRFDILDFSTPQGLSGLERAVSEANLVLVPMLLSETADRSKPGEITNAIFRAMPGRSRLVICDTSWYGRNGVTLKLLQGLRNDGQLIWNEDVVYECQNSHEDLDKYLYVPRSQEGYEGLLRRKKIEMMTAIFRFG